MNPMATMNTQKHRGPEEDDCFMDDVGNEGINLIGVDYEDDTPVERLKIDEDSVRKSKEQFNFKKSTHISKARSRYMEEDDQVHMDTEEDMYSKPNLHLG